MSEAEVTLPAAPAADLTAMARKEASRVLFVVALVFRCNTLLIVLLPRLLNADIDRGRMALAVGWTVGLAAVFGGLGAWALYSPLRAAVVGLGLYVVFAALAVASAPLDKSIILHLLLVALLIKAVRTCRKAGVSS
jgi:hypothetical protein